MSPIEQQVAALERIAAALERLVDQQSPEPPRLTVIEGEGGICTIGGWAGEPELAGLVGKRFYSRRQAELAIEEAIGA